MKHLIGKTVIFQTKRKLTKNKSLKPLFPEHIFSATIQKVKGGFILVTNVKLLFSEGEHNGEYLFLARDKLNCYIPPKNIINDTHLIKIKNNLYFDIEIYKQKMDLLNSIENHIRSPKLYDICFYKLSSIEINFARQLFNIY